MIPVVAGELTLPLLLAVGFFNARRRLLHDILVGTVVLNSAERAASLRAPATSHTRFGL